MSEPATPTQRLGLPGHASPAAGFEVPLEMLAACHGRVQGQCETLRRLVAHLPGHGADAQAQAAAAAVMRYFDTAAHLHHEDEELDLFPALLESMAGSDPVCLRELTHGLAAEHRVLERAWCSLRRRLEPLAGGQAADLPSTVVEDFIGLYERHIAREESELLPMAQRLLSDAELDRIGISMRERRAAAEAPPSNPSPAA